MKKLLLLGLMVLTSLSLYGCYDTETTIYTLENVEGQISAVYEEVDDMTVAVVSYVDDTYDIVAGHGSGLIYDREAIEVGYRYYVITNYHVVESQAYIKIYNGITYYQANPFAINEVEDLALVTFDTVDEITIFGTEQFSGEVYAKPTIGSFVLAVGTPLDLEFYNTATLGIVGQTSNPKVIQHDASINPGNSGGPLFDLNGNLLGFNTWKRAAVNTAEGEIAVEGIGFAISMLVAIPTINQMRQTGESVFLAPKIGVTVTTVPEAIEDLFDGVRPEHIEETQTTGIYVLSVVPLRPAYGKIYAKDIITHVNGNAVSTIEDLAGLIADAEFGTSLELAIRRYDNGVFSTVNIIIIL
jgi:S1-C subfamily serine protease